MGTGWIGEGQRLAAAIEADAVELAAQAGRDLDGHVGRQGRHERQGQMQGRQFMPALHRAVVEDDEAVAEHDVVDRELGLQRRGCRGVRRWGGKALDQVIDVIAPLGDAGDAQLRSVQLERGDDHMPAQQRAQGQRGLQLRQFEQRRLARSGAGDAQALDDQPEPPGLKARLLDAHRAAKAFSGQRRATAGDPTRQHQGRGQQGQCKQGGEQDKRPQAEAQQVTSVGHHGPRIIDVGDDVGREPLP
mmetsp:Transcript_37917/g.93183  ORF Transcript_37917/g.93183 Transcript_37917/m.93183 type:complete len:246 (+) Transcript_37917:336-1073(+)